MGNVRRITPADRLAAALARELDGLTDAEAAGAAVEAAAAYARRRGCTLAMVEVLLASSWRNCSGIVER